MVFLGCFVAQTRGVIFTRDGDNVDFVREPCYLFDPTSVKVGLSWTGVYTFWGYLEARVASIINPLGTARKSSEMQCILRIMQLLPNICDITMNRH